MKDKMREELEDLKRNNRALQCRLEVSEATLKTIRGCLSSAESDIDRLEIENGKLREASVRAEDIRDESCLHKRPVNNLTDIYKPKVRIETMNGKMREEFQEWYRSMVTPNVNIDFWRNENCEYGNSFTQGCWEAWQASREAITVDLPETRWGDPYSDGWNGMHDRARQAIEAAGVKVKA